ncbi:hypothetical protein TrVE_jg2695 [Triparma verrucosa]|uniref:Protein kinase domain-containing protein n=1 Tax=Triparma verrucosa TaxID=1606542 RepID=A0A9W7ESJ5_9STRA|nr:hypothetical protein TrVE_jg2695 [Triparma verrucosa]
MYEASTASSDFIFWTQLGQGAFGTVWLAQEKRREKRFLAIKTINKKSIVTSDEEEQNRKVQRLLNERQILQHCDHPFVVTLLYFFQDSTRLYFGMSMAGCGDFYTIVGETNKGEGLPMHACRFYAAELCLALEYIHGLGIIYRDMKLENFLLSAEGHIVLTDFGMATYQARDRTSSVVGTPEYFAPEIVKEEMYSVEVDWWAFGVCLFEMMCGKSPFSASSIASTMKNVMMKEAKLPPRAFRGCSKPEQKATQQVIQGLLHKDPAKRLGFSGLKEHQWFTEYKIVEDVNVANEKWCWEDVLAKKVKVPLKRTDILKSPAVVSLMEARFAKDRKDSKVFEDLKPFNRAASAVGVGSGALKLPQLGGGAELGESASSPALLLKEKEKEEDPSQELKGSQESNPTALPPVTVTSTNEKPDSAPNHASDFVDPVETVDPVSLEDVPILRTVTYTLKPDLFKDDPKGQDVALADYLSGISDVWKDAVQGYTFFGYQHKKPSRKVTLSMVFKNAHYLDLYQRETKATILNLFKMDLDENKKYVDLVADDEGEEGTTAGDLAEDEMIVHMAALSSATNSPVDGLTRTIQTTSVGES